VETCDRTELDTRIAVYEGCGCPADGERLLDCSDDDCSVQTRVTFAATAGQQYLIRVGTFPGTDGGAGSLSIQCGFEGCPGQGSCASAQAGAGCDDEECCNAVCSVDSVCCLQAWDEVCAEEASAFCNGGFETCGGGNGACTESRTSPGCGDADCCNAVCAIDTYCCMEEWDRECVALEARTCFSACGESTEACSAAHSGPGCNDAACCAEVCPREPSCCTTEWSAACVDLAGEHCD